MARSEKKVQEWLLTVFQHLTLISKMRADYNGVARSRLMDAMQSVMNQRSKLRGADPTVTKIKTGQWIPDADRVAAESRLSRNALARILSALAGTPQDPSTGQQLFSSGKVDIDPRVYLIELSNNFLQVGTMFDPHGVNEPDHLRIVYQVVRGNLDVAMKLLVAKPDKDLESRAKKMQADCDKTLKKLGS